MPLSIAPCGAHASSAPLQQGSGGRLHAPGKGQHWGTAQWELSGQAQAGANQKVPAKKPGTALALDPTDSYIPPQSASRSAPHLSFTGCANGGQSQAAASTWPMRSPLSRAGLIPCRSTPGHEPGTEGRWVHSTAVAFRPSRRRHRYVPITHADRQQQGAAPSPGTLPVF